MRWVEEALKDVFYPGEFIFAESGFDLFARNVPMEKIKGALEFYSGFPDTKVLLHTKDPEGIQRSLNKGAVLSDNFVVGVTYETDVHYKEIYKGPCPSPENRIKALKEISKDHSDTEIWVTLDPILKGDRNRMLKDIMSCKPDVVHIGAATNLRRGDTVISLPQAPREDILWLIDGFNEAKVNVVFFTTFLSSFFGDKKAKNRARLRQEERLRRIEKENNIKYNYDFRFVR